ncbi:hypothetical protein ACFYZT_24735 [Streptomyces sp. NPDC001591]|uniref:hypothetical protein n=1 Tax=Streptomyces TaxID=1883 RepID=UPI0024A42D74|nr:hypothetical protein [Streptomyces lavendulae]GLW03692.1 hypothetical protein Slala05_73220 [Streptomyces lavendulae subsp. lavendulae]
MGKKTDAGALGDVLSLDIDSLTIDEIDVIEDIIDGPLDSLAKPGARKAKLLRAMAVVIKQREDPTFSAEDAGKLRIEFKQKARQDPPALNG